MKTKRMISLSLVLALILTFGLAVIGQESITGDEILTKVDKQQDKISQGDLITILTFEIRHPDGTKTAQKFGSLAKTRPEEPDYSLMYYLKPESVAGTIILSRETEEGESEMWILLAAFGQRKKLSGSQQQSSFADSNLTRQEIGNRNMSKRYNAELLDETELTIDGESVPAYVLETELKEDATANYPSGKVWVGKDNWLILKSKDRNEDGKLERIMEVEKLGTFEKKTVTEKLTAENVLKGSSTTVTFVKRERLEEKIPSSVFDPENLPEFDPKKWRIKE